MNEHDRSICRASSPEVRLIFSTSCDEDRVLCAEVQSSSEKGVRGSGSWASLPSAPLHVVPDLSDEALPLQLSPPNGTILMFRILQSLALK